VVETRAPSWAHGVALEERERAERYGGASACLLVERALGNERPLDSLRARLRSTDSIHVVGPNRVAILLRDTDRAGTEHVIDGLESESWIPIAPPEFVGGPLLPVLPVERRKAERTSDAPAPRVAVSTDPDGLLTLLVRRLPPWKRCADVVLSVLGLTLLAPLFLAIAVAIRLTSPGPALFRQRRTGRAFKRFDMLKFRTMQVDAEEKLAALRDKNEVTGPVFKMDDDPRLTPIGSFLRRTSLDELPQFWNVLKGEMTLIGPRALSPIPARYERWQLPRFELTPGIACSWQARCRGEARFEEWMRSDRRYALSPYSARSDLRLFLSTLLAVITREGSR